MGDLCDNTNGHVAFQANCRRVDNGWLVSQRVLVTPEGASQAFSSVSDFVDHQQFLCQYIRVNVLPPLLPKEYFLARKRPRSLIGQLLDSIRDFGNMLACMTLYTPACSPVSAARKQGDIRRLFELINISL